MEEKDANHSNHRISDYAEAGIIRNFLHILDWISKSGYPSCFNTTSHVEIVSTRETRHLAEC